LVKKSNAEIVKIAPTNLPCISRSFKIYFIIINYYYYYKYIIIFLMSLE